jgi:hypothetical protein
MRAHERNAPSATRIIISPDPEPRHNPIDSHLPLRPYRESIAQCRVGPHLPDIKEPMNVVESGPRFFLLLPFLVTVVVNMDQLITSSTNTSTCDSRRTWNINFKRRQKV